MRQSNCGLVEFSIYSMVFQVRILMSGAFVLFIKDHQAAIYDPLFILFDTPNWHALCILFALKLKAINYSCLSSGHLNDFNVLITCVSIRIPRHFLRHPVFFNSRPSIQAVLSLNSFRGNYCECRTNSLALKPIFC